MLVSGNGTWKRNGSPSKVSGPGYNNSNNNIIISGPEYKIV